MDFKKIIGGLSKLSFFKTLKINLHYFGLKGVFKTPILVSRSVKLTSLHGEIILDKLKRGTVRLGFCFNPIFKLLPLKSVFYNEGKIIVHDELNLWKGSSIQVDPNGILEIGKCFINSNTNIVCKKNVKIGYDTIIGWGVYYRYRLSRNI